MRRLMRDDRSRSFRVLLKSAGMRALKSNQSWAKRKAAIFAPIKHPLRKSSRAAQEAAEQPMHYVGRWRMQSAARRIDNSNVSIAQAGAEMGYESEAALNRTFKKIVGVTPETGGRHVPSGQASLGKHVGDLVERPIAW